MVLVVENPNLESNEVNVMNIVKMGCMATGATGDRTNYGRSKSTIFVRKKSGIPDFSNILCEQYYAYACTYNRLQGVLLIFVVKKIVIYRYKSEFKKIKFNHNSIPIDCGKDLKMYKPFSSFDVLLCQYFIMSVIYCTGIKIVTLFGVILSITMSI